MIKQKDKIESALVNYLPDFYIKPIVELIFSESLIFKISKPRKTKLGDYRQPYNGKPHSITINGDLNPYSFLITTLHEFAHLRAFKKHGGKIKSHGEEWKHEFRQLLIPLMEKEELPIEIKTALKISFNNLRASSCINIELYQILQKFDEDSSNTKILLTEIEHGAIFRINNRIFQKGELIRTRYNCVEVNTGRKYLIHKVAKIERL